MQHRASKLIEERAEAELSELLFAFGAESVSSEPAGERLKITAIFSELSGAEHFLSENGFVVEELGEDEWRYSWLQWYEGGELTPSIYLKPFSEDRKTLEKLDYKYTLLLDPRDAFGDGRHPTTRQCARFLEELLQEQTEAELEAINLLDAGTGTGILAIIGALMGVKQIDAVDIEQESVERTAENCRLNGVTGLKLSLADISDFRGKRSFDIICANLLTNIILKNINHLAALLKSGGKLIISGISAEWGHEVEEAAAKVGLIKVDKTIEDNWCCYLFSK